VFAKSDVATEATASQNAPAHSGRVPALGVSYEGRDPELLSMMLSHVDSIEVTPETIAEVRGNEIVLSPDIVAELKNAERDVQIVVHGVSLSIGSHDGWQSTYLRLLDTLMSQMRVAWHSEHLGYTCVDGHHLGIMLALPRTEQALDLVCERILRLQSTFGIPFLLENIVHVVPPHPEGYSPAGFLNEIAARTGCGLLLDVYNLECDAHNHGLDIAAFLAELDGSAVRELHLACGVEHNGFLLDVHSRLTRPCTVTLAQEVLAAVAPQAQLAVYEFMPEAVPGLGREAIAHELARLRGGLVAAA
jgi:uncharacterized protein (UPF0276 family)